MKRRKRRIITIETIEGDSRKEKIMKRTIIILAILATTFSCADKVSSKKNKVETNSGVNTVKSTDNKNIKQVSIKSTSVTQNVDKEKFASLIAKNDGLILDVRTVREYSAGNIDGSVNINVSDGSFKEKVSALDKNKPVYVYCKSGGRSSRAMSIMKGMGFQEIYNLKGGYDGWK